MAESSFQRELRRRDAAREARRAFCFGLPALFALTVALLLINTASQHVADGSARSHYLRGLDRSLKDGNWEQVRFISRKLALLRPGDRLALYYLARCADHEQHHERARRLMEEIAPADQPGYPAAHWWLAQHYAAATSPTVEQLRLAREHALRLLELEPEQAQAHMLLGRLDLATGQTAAALSRFDAATRETPALHLEVARALQPLAQPATMASHARQAADFHRRETARNPHDADARIHWADALTMLGQIKAAADVLRSGWRLTDDPQLRARLAALCVEEYDAFAATPITVRSLTSQLELLQQALAAVPAHEGALLRLTYLTSRDPDHSTRAHDLLQEVLASGRAPALVHTILGGQALSRNDPETARLHFEAAHQLEPQSPACLNNLAWALAQRSSHDLPRALQLAETAVRLSPDHSEIRQTKGQILLMMGLHREALPEFERGLHGAVDRADIHRSLAEIYDQLGQPALADRHRQFESESVRR